VYSDRQAESGKETREVRAPKCELTGPGPDVSDEDWESGKESEERSNVEVRMTNDGTCVPGRPQIREEIFRRCGFVRVSAR